MEPIRRSMDHQIRKHASDASRQAKLSFGLVMVMSAGIAMAATGLLSRPVPAAPAGSQLIIAIEPQPPSLHGIHRQALPETGETSLAMRLP